MPDVSIPLTALRGRGAANRLPHRFESDLRHTFDDGWDSLSQEGGAPPATEVTWEDARSVITTNDSPDVYFDRAINPYRGCEHVMRHGNLLPGRHGVGVLRVSYNRLFLGQAGWNSR